MGVQASKTNFDWIDTKDPHVNRRREIIKKYPQIKKLFGADPKTKWIVLVLVLLQVASLPLVSQMSWPILITFAYCFGGVVNHALFLAMHEILHGLGFGHGRPLANKILGIFANLPLGTPYYSSFKKYHLDHHKELGDDVFDTDHPTELEARLFRTTGGRVLWLFFQPLIYGVRQRIVRPIPLTLFDAVNLVAQLAFDLAVYYIFGFKALFYLLCGSFLAMGIHPVAGHLIASHFTYFKGVETNSYYGPLNRLTFNIGYHNEHHDFPAVPWSKLPEVKAIAPEYYDTVPHHSSWIQAMYRFVVDPNMGMFSRIKRETRLSENQKS